MRKIFNLALLTLIGTQMLFFASCTSYKNVPYIQNSAYVDYSEGTRLYDARIMPKDQLTITVNCPRDPEATAIYNLTVQTELSASMSRRTSLQQPSLQTYLVSNKGEINFPELGTLKVIGMTKTELEEFIANKLHGQYLKEKPIVTVTMSNYKVAVMGEVTQPGIYTVSNGKVNIFEALAMARDLTIHGQRENVKLIREDATGRKEVVELNLNDANVINSPYYQLQQNDIIYVTPNKTKAKNSGIGSETSLWFSATSILVSLASLLYNILKYGVGNDF